MNLWEIAGVAPHEAHRLTERDLAAITRHHQRKQARGD